MSVKLPSVRTIVAQSMLFGILLSLPCACKKGTDNPAPTGAPNANAAPQTGLPPVESEAMAAFAAEVHKHWGLDAAKWEPSKATWIDETRSHPLGGSPIRSWHTSASGLWGKKNQQNGLLSDGTRLYPGDYLECKDVRIEVTPDSVAEADTLNGIKWRGSIMLIAPTWRTGSSSRYFQNSSSGQGPHWDEWRNGAMNLFGEKKYGDEMLHVILVKRSDAWSLDSPLDGEPLISETLAPEQPAKTDAAPIGEVRPDSRIAAGSIPPKVQQNPGTVFFTDDDGATFFADSMEKMGGFDHNGKQAFYCKVYALNGRQFVGSITKYLNFGSEKKSDVLVKRPGPNPWIARDNPASDEILQPPTVDGVRPTVVYPEGSPIHEARAGAIARHEQKAYFTDDDGRTFFVDSYAKGRAFDHNGKPAFDHNGKPAFACQVFEVNGSRTVGYIMKLDPNPSKPGGVDTLVKKPGASEWVSIYAAAARAITQVKNADGTSAQTVSPDK